MADTSSKNGIIDAEAAVLSLDDTVDGVVAENSSRGGNGFTAALLSAMDRRQMQMRMNYPYSCIPGDVLCSVEGDRYRTGMENGVRIFTVDDFLRLREDRNRLRDSSLKNTYAVEAAGLDAAKLERKRPAAAYSCADAVVAVSARPASEVFFANGEADMVVRDRSKAHPILTPLKEKLAKYHEAPNVVVTRHSWKLTSGTIAALCLVFVFALLISLPVVMNILIHQESGTIADLDREIRTAEAEVTQLEISLNQKNDRATLEKLAVETYGLVRLDISHYTILQLNPADAIETMEKEKNGGVVPTLLKALGLRSED